MAGATMTKRQIYLPGGGGDCKPTVVINDYIGQEDEIEFSWEQGDIVSAEDTLSLGWKRPDYISAEDEHRWASNRPDFVSAKDSPVIGFSMGDVVSVKDEMPFAWTQTEMISQKDNALITGLGTPQWLDAWRVTYNSYGGGTVPVTGAYGGAASAGDLLICFVARRNLGDDPNINIIPPGWTLLHHTNIGLDNAESYWKLAGPNEPDSYNFWNNSSSLIRAEVHLLNGVSQTAPINASVSAVHSAATLNPDPPSPSLTTTVPNCLVISFLSHDHLALIQNHAATSGHISRTDFGMLSEGQSQGNHSQSRAFGTAGATGTVVHDCTETVATNGLLHRIAIAPGPISIAL